MKPIGVAAAAFFVMGVTASSAQAPATEAQLLGTWSCTGDSNGAVLKGPYTFLAGGKSRMEMAMTVAAASREMSGAGNGTWKMLPDGKLEEVITDFKLSEAKLGGAATDIAPMQSMIDTMVVNQVVTSTVKLEPTSLVLTDQMGQVTTCTR